MPMSFNEAEKRIKRLKKDSKAGKIKNHAIKQNLMKSYCNQVKLGHGKDAVDYMTKVVDGSGKITSKGFGLGSRDWKGFKRVGPGHWRKVYK